MKNGRFSDAQIMGILKQAEGGTPVSELCREHGMSSASFYKWRAKFGGMDADLPPEAPSFIMRVCGFGFHIPRFRFGQARRARSPQIAQVLDALGRVFGCPEMSAV